MNARPLDSIKWRHAWGVWLGLWLLLWQIVASAGLIQAPMSSIHSVADGIVICGDDGMRTVPDGGVPGHSPSHDGAASCPCCLPFSAGAGGAILASAASLPIAVWSATVPTLASTAASRPHGAASSPQQPRAPPVLV